MRVVVLALLVGACLAGTTAFAAALGVTSTRLTTWSAVSSVPVSSCNLVASADTYVDSGSAATSFGTAVDLRVRSSLVTGNRRTFALFDVGSCVPGGARITTAALGLHLATAPSGARTYGAHRVTSAWLESVTWNGQPSVAGSATASTSTGTTSGVTLSWDVASDVQVFASGTANHGWRISDQAEGAVVAVESVFSSREAASNRPALSITYYP